MSAVAVVEVDVGAPYAAIDAGPGEAGVQSIIEAALDGGIIIGLSDAAEDIVVGQCGAAGELARRPPARLFFLLRRRLCRLLRMRPNNDGDQQRYGNRQDPRQMAHILLLSSG